MASIIVETLFWLTVFLGTGALLFCSVYTLLLYADLNADFINPIDLCQYVNRLIVPEYFGHLLLTLLILSRGFLVPTLLNVPLMLFHFRQYLDRRHFLDCTTIYNEKDRRIKTAQIKLIYILVLFFVYLYCFIATLIAS